MLDKTNDKSRILNRKNLRAYKAKQILTMYLPIPLGLLAILCAVLAYGAITAPLEKEQVAATQFLNQEVVFDYTAIPQVSTLYPSKTALGRKPTYFVNLTDQFKVSILGNISAEEGLAVKGTHKVLMQLKAGGLWTKDYVLSPETQFTGAGEFTALSLPVTLPIADLLAFGAQVAKEAGTGGSSYTLTLMPQIKVQTEGEEAPLANDFRASFAFELTNLQITPKGLPKDRYSEDGDPAQDLVQTQSVSRQIKETVPNNLVFLKGHIPVMTGRVLYICLALLMFALSGWLIKRHIKERPHLTEAESILKKYKSKIAEVKTGSFGPNTQTIQLGSFQALLNIAEDSEKPILYTTNLDGVASGHIYYMIDVGVTYVYFITESFEAEC